MLPARPTTRLTNHVPTTCSTAQPAAATTAPFQRWIHGWLGVSTTNTPRIAPVTAPKATITTPTRPTTGNPPTVATAAAAAEPTSSASPRMPTAARARRRRFTAVDRARRGMAHTVSKAYCIPRPIPSPAHSAVSTPMRSASPLPSIDPMLVVRSSPITGNWARVESSTSWRNDGFPASTRPSTVTSTSSSGNNEKKA